MEDCSSYTFVMLNFICQVDWDTEWPNKHDFWCDSEGVFR